MAREGDLSAALFALEPNVTWTRPVTWWPRSVGGVVVGADLEQRQVDERYVMTVSDGEAWYEFVRDGKTLRTRRDWTSDTLTIDQLPSFVTSQWDRLIDGGEISFRLVALGRVRILRFRLTYRGEIANLGRPPHGGEQHVRQAVGARGRSGLCA